MANLQIVAVAAANKSVVEAQYVEMKVPLYSFGCEKKVKKALSRFKGIYSINVDFEEQKVTVWGICNKFDVLATIKNKRKGACFWKPEENTELEELPAPAPSSALALIKGRRSLIRWKTLKVFLRSYTL